MLKEVEELMTEYLLLAVQDADIFQQTRDHYRNVLFDKIPERMFVRKHGQLNEARMQLHCACIFFNRLWDTDQSFRSLCKTASQTITEVLSVVETEQMRQEGRLSPPQPQPPA